MSDDKPRRRDLGTTLTAAGSAALCLAAPTVLGALGDALTRSVVVGAAITLLVVSLVILAQRRLALRGDRP